MNKLDPREAINFRQLRCFHAVAVEGSFTAAAKLLGLGQPSVTTHVRTLEDYFGIELFSRSGHHVELTDLGRDLLTLTQRIFSLESEATELLRAASGLKVGNLRIGSIGPSQVTGIILAFGQAHPEVELSVTLGNSQEVANRVREFRDDVGIVPQFEKDRRFHSVPYSRNRVVLLVPQSHDWGKRGSIGIAELEAQRMVLREVGSATRRAFEDALHRAGVNIRRVLAISSREAVREAVAAGLGVGIALEDETLPDERLTTLQVSDVDIHLDTHVICLRERREAPLIRAFFDMVGDVAGRV